MFILTNLKIVDLPGGGTGATLGGDHTEDATSV